MPREINEEQLVRVLLGVNWLIRGDDLLVDAQQSAETASQYPQAATVLWNKEIVQRWAGCFPQILAMATAGNFSEVLDTLYEELEKLRRDPK